MRPLKLIKLIVFSVFIASSLAIVTPAVVYADEHTPPDRSCDLDQNILGIPTWYKYLNATEDASGRCSPQISDAQSALPIGIAVLEAMLRFAGLAAVVMIFVGAFKYITSRGNPDNAAAARKTVINALIGLVIVIVSTSFVSFFGNSLVSSTPPEDSSYIGGMYV